MDAVTKQLIQEIVGPVIADYVKEVRALKEQVEHIKRQVVVLQLNERGRRNRDLIRAAEATAA